MNYLVKYLDKYNGGKVFHYFDNQKDYEKFVDELNKKMEEEMMIGKAWTSYKVYRFSNKDSVIDTLLNSINHSGLDVEADIVADLMKD